MTMMRDAIKQEGVCDLIASHVHIHAFEPAPNTHRLLRDVSTTQHQQHGHFEPDGGRLFTGSGYDV